MIHPLLELTNDRTGDPMLINPNDIASINTVESESGDTRTEIAVGVAAYPRFLFCAETPAQVRDAIWALRDQEAQKLRARREAASIPAPEPIGPTVETGGLGFGAGA